MGRRTGVRREFTYVEAATAGDGFMPWQDRASGSTTERACRDEVEQRKQAVAVRLETAWATSLVLSGFRRETVVAGIRFCGKFGVICRTPEGRRWLMSRGATTGEEATQSPAKGPERLGIADRPAFWRGKVASRTERELVPETARPTGWTPAPEGAVTYVLLRIPRYLTGLPGRAVGRRRIELERFPLPAAGRFGLLAVRSREA